MDRFTVIGQCEIAGVLPGNVVELDPQQVNIPALIAGGHIKPASDTEDETP